jgi:hypothetical protein
MKRTLKLYDVFINLQMSLLLNLIMQNQDETGLTISETTNLWMQYNSESMDICIKRYILAHMEDIEIKSVVEHAFNLSKQHIQKIKNFFEQEKYPYLLVLQMRM